MTQNTPPQIIILSIIAKSSEGLTLKELISHIVNLCKINALPEYYYSCGKGESIVKEVLLDLNTLKVLGLVGEVNGKYVITEKGYDVLGRLSKKAKVSI